MPSLLSILLLVLVSTSTVVAKDWRGILPLHSTRADVEKLLGPPPQPPEDRAYTLHKGRSIYYLEEGEVYILFAGNEFLQLPNCDSVPAGIVLSIRVTPKANLLLSSLNLNEKAFRKFDASEPAEQGFEGFIDDKDGLVIRAFKAMVEEIVYLPYASDRERCSSYYENPEHFVLKKQVVCGMALDQYGNLRWDDEQARLDNFAIQLSKFENMVGYIIAYAGRKATVAEAQTRANRARDYVINVREIDPQRVKAIDAGYQDQMTVYLHLIPVGVEPPIMPTVDPGQVEIIYEKKRRPSKKRN